MMLAGVAHLQLLCRRLLSLCLRLLLPGALGPACFGHAVANLLLADLLSNIHSFLTIVSARGSHLADW